MTVIIYSANINDYDGFKNVNLEDPSVRYMLFTDNKIFKSKSWEVYHVDFLRKIKDNRKIARYIKVNSHLVLPPHDVSIWVDHCFSPRIKNVNSFLEEIKISNKDVLCFKHDWRNCLYEEAEIVKEKKLDNTNIVDNQMSKYRSENFPEKYGLYSTGFMVRKNDEKIKKFNEEWWDQINSYSGRDQLSQMYASWKTNATINPISNLSVYENPYITKKIKHTK